MRNINSLIGIKLLIVSSLTNLYTSPVKAAAVAKGCGDVSTLVVDKVLVKPVIATTLFILNPDDIRVPIPINQPTTGEASGSARASNFFGSDKDDANNQGVILTPGPPPVAGSVGIRKVEADVTGADSEAEASIAAAVNANPQGQIFGATAFTSTMCDANALFGIASSAAAAGTDPFVVDPQPEAVKGQLEVDLISNLSSSSDAAFGLQADRTLPIGFAEASYSLKGISNIPDIPVLFDLNFSVTSKSNQVKVDFFSPLISQPIFADDFTNPIRNGQPLENAYILDPTKSVFNVPFNLPNDLTQMSPRIPYLLKVGMNWRPTKKSTEGSPYSSGF